MRIRQVIMLYAILVIFGFSAQPERTVRVNFHIFEEDTRNTTPAMVCITRLNDSSIVNYSEPTYPAPFYTGINYSPDRQWIGPVRKTSGKGEINGQRTYVYGNNPTLPYWKEPVFYQVSGDFSLQLQPGKYRISIEHGNEYIPVTEEFIVKKTDADLHQSFLLKRWIDLPSRGWYSGDVHTHHASDQQKFNDYMLEFARAEDVHLVNILEMGDRRSTHFKAASFGARSAMCRNDICLVWGQEEPRSNYGHVIGLNTESLARDTANYNHYDIVFDKIHKAPEALAGYAHFAYRGEGVVEGMAIYAPTNNVNFVELMQNTQLNKEDYYDYLNLGFRIAAAAGSDFPWGSTIGDGRTFVYTGNSFSHYNWFAGLKKGNTFVSNGPALFLEVNGNMPGTEIKTSSGDRIAISCKAISQKNIGIIKAVEIYNNDGLIVRQENTNRADSVIINMSRKVEKSQWICAFVECENGALAHTSPVYILYNDQPVFDKEKAPAIIDKLLGILDSVRSKEEASGAPDKGVLERVERARQYYLERR